MRVVLLSKDLHNFSTNLKKKEFLMPSWPTLYPLFLHYKQEIPFPFGNTETTTQDSYVYPQFLQKNIRPLVTSDQLYAK